MFAGDRLAVSWDDVNAKFVGTICACILIVVMNSVLKLNRVDVAKGPRRVGRNEGRTIRC